MTRKSAAPDSFRLLVDPLRKAPPAFGDLPRKNVHAGLPSAASSHRPRGLSSDPLRQLEKEQLRTTFGFGSILSKKFCQPLEMYPEKMFRSDNFRLLLPTDREAPQVTRCDSSKKSSPGQPSAFGRSPAKSLSSLRRFTPKKCSCRTAFGFGSIRSKKPLQCSEMYPEKMFMPDYLRLPFHTDREAPQVARCDDPKKCGSRQP